MKTRGFEAATVNDWREKGKTLGSVCAIVEVDDVERCRWFVRWNFESTNKINVVNVGFMRLGRRKERFE